MAHLHEFHNEVNCEPGCASRPVGKTGYDIRKTAEKAHALNLLHAALWCQRNGACRQLPTLVDTSRRTRWNSSTSLCAVSLRTFTATGMVRLRVPLYTCSIDSCESHDPLRMC